MIKEDTEKAANDFADREYEYNDIDRNALYKGFYWGAQWRISSVWNDPTVEAIRDVDILIEDIRGNFSVHKFYLGKWKNMVIVYEIKRWAYMKDLIPNKED